MLETTDAASSPTETPGSSSVALGSGLQRPKLSQQRSRATTSTSPPPPLPLISLPPEDEFDEFSTPTRSGFAYELPYVDLPLEEYDDTSASSIDLGAEAEATNRRRTRDAFPLAPDPDRLKSCRLLSAYMTQNEMFQTARHGFGIDTRLVYKRSKGTDAPVPTAGAAGSSTDDDVRFNALFESGNLDRAYRVCNRHYGSSGELLGASPSSTSSLLPPFAFFVQVDLEYDLYCDVDVNTHGHVQWYFFRTTLAATTAPSSPQSASGQATTTTKVRFNLRNMLKRASLYNDGMLPAVYIDGPASVRRGWHHAGANVCYFKNADTYRNRKTGTVQHFYTLSFVYEFATDWTSSRPMTDVDAPLTPTPATVVYFAHCYPYPYTRLQRFLLTLQHDPERRQHLKRRVLCKTLAGNNCDVVTITDFAIEDAAETPYAAKRAGIFLTARVHPGESNSSFVMHGLLDFLTGSSLEARYLRRHFVFKLVPMLNPDGVVHGNYRCSLAGTDLNRRWATPSAELHPTIFAAKTALLSMKTTRPLALYCDFHGHSRKKNVFLYGCRPFAPSCRADAARVRVFPHLLAKASNAHNGGFYSFADSTFSVSRAKKGTARVVVWREAAVLHSFTLEASFFGVGVNKKQHQLTGTTTTTTTTGGLKHYTAFDLRAVGAKFCIALLPFARVVNLDRVAVLADAHLAHRDAGSSSILPSETTTPGFQPCETSPTALSHRSVATNKLLLAPLHSQNALVPSSQRADKEEPHPLLSPNQLDRRLPTPRQFCEPRDVVSPPSEVAAVVRSVSTPPLVSSGPSSCSPSEFDALFADDDMAALLSLADPQALLKEIEAALPDCLTDGDDGSVGSESDPSGDNMETKELESVPSWTSIRPRRTENAVADLQATKLQRARPLRLLRHLSEPRLCVCISSHGCACGRQLTDGLTCLLVRMWVSQTPPSEFEESPRTGRSGACSGGAQGRATACCSRACSDARASASAAEGSGPRRVAPEPPERPEPRHCVAPLASRPATLQVPPRAPAASVRSDRVLREEEKELARTAHDDHETHTHNHKRPVSTTVLTRAITLG